MAIVVNTNIASVNAQRNLEQSSSSLGKSLERLSSGLRINRAGDDAAGLAIATKLQAQTRGLNQATRNVNNAISLVQTAEGALNTITNIMQRLRELAVQAASDDNTPSDRLTLTDESNQLVEELTRLANTSEFNGAPLLDGSFANRLFQIGANFGQTVTFTLGDVRAKSLGSRTAIEPGGLTDGAQNGINANAATGEVTINGQNVVTSDGDDQVSVVELLSQELGSTVASNIGIGTSLATTTNSSLVFNGVIQKDDEGGFVSIVGTLVTKATSAGADAATSTGSFFLVRASLTVGDSGTTISTAVATSASVAIELFSSYGSIGITTGATISAATGDVVQVNATLTYASLNFAASVSGTQFEVNGQFVNFTAASVDTYASVASFLGRIVADINAASITNVQAVARTPSSAIARQILLQATKGVNLALKTSGASVASNLYFSETFATNTATTVIYNGQSSAIGKAAAVNAVRGVTTVLADANSNVVTGANAIAAVTIRGGDLAINGVDIGAVDVLANDGSGALVTAINAQRDSTGVTASVNSENKLVLTAGDGRNVAVRSNATINTALGIGGSTNTNNVYRGSLTLSSSREVKVGGTNVSELGADLAVKTYTPDLTNRLSLVDLSSQDSAEQAILTIDAALDQANKIRAGIGAVQSRLENTVVNLRIAAENFTASESRIRDADFAFETAQFTRNQILVQAGTAILAQANSLPQVALQLLQ